MLPAGPSISLHRTITHHGRSSASGDQIVLASPAGRIHHRSSRSNPLVAAAAATLSAFADTDEINALLSLRETQPCQTIAELLPPVPSAGTHCPRACRGSVHQHRLRRLQLWYVARRAGALDPPDTTHGPTLK